MRARLLTAVAASGLMALGTASTAGAAVTIGQTGDATGSGCSSGFDWVQRTIPSGVNSFVVPAVGTITAWSMDGSGVTGQQLTMKMFRKIGEPASYRVVGHGGPETLTSPGRNTFPANVPVMPGDVLGFHTVSNSSRCNIFVPDASIHFFAGNLGDGAEGAFSQDNGYYLSIEATFDPDRTFTLGAITRNKKKGTATITVTVPNPGDLSGSGKGAKVAAGATISKAVTPGAATLVVRAKGKKKRKLNETGKVKLNVAVTYTPTGGSPNTQTTKVKLKKKL
jgi:hypothetical protein